MDCLNRGKVVLPIRMFLYRPGLEGKKACRRGQFKGPPGRWFFGCSWNMGGKTTGEQSSGKKKKKTRGPRGCQRPGFFAPTGPIGISPPRCTEKALWDVAGIGGSYFGWKFSPGAGRIKGRAYCLNFPPQLFGKKKPFAREPTRGLQGSPKQNLAALEKGFLSSFFGKRKPNVCFVFPARAGWWGSPLIRDKAQQPWERRGAGGNKAPQTMGAQKKKTKLVPQFFSESPVVFRKTPWGDPGGRGR